MPPESPVTMIFDGTCGFCTRVARLARARDREGRITWIPCQQYPLDAPDAQGCLGSVIAIDRNGNRESGAKAAARMLEGITGSAWPVRIASMPVISPVLEAGYQVIARLRSHLPGDIPWCEQHPDECHHGDRS